MSDVRAVSRDDRPSRCPTWRDAAEPATDARMSPLLLVGVGGAIGSVLRFIFGQAAARALGPGFPFGTWGVNIIGGLAMGLLAGWLSLRGGDEALRLLLGVGVLGGFTTFSAFSLELFDMVVHGEPLLAAAYAISSVAASIVMLWAGVALARMAA
jgi:CrcB protein